nr:MAG TPA: hypothetical protein [Caudoviricetes sp.]
MIRFSTLVFGKSKQKLENTMGRKLTRSTVLYYKYRSECEL